MKAIVKKKIESGPFPLPEGMIIFELEDGGSIVTSDPCGFNENDIIEVIIDSNGNWEADLIENGK